MRDQLMEMVRGFPQTDFENNANLKFLAAYRRQLIDVGFSIATAESIASVMEVSIPDGLLSNDDIEEAAKCYAVTIKKIAEAVLKEGFVDVIMVLKKIASEVTLKATL